MCGIAGVVTRDGALPTDIVDAANVGMRHRGPEATARRDLEGPGVRCSLGHARLRIIDMSETADQPLSNEDGTVWVTFNGELYDFPERRRELEASGHRFATATDTEILVHLYEAVDDDPARMLEMLRGMFAFALFDRRRGRLVLGRDRLGVKPLYVARTDEGGLAFASEASVLAQSGAVTTGPESAAVAGYLVWGSVQGPQTIYSGIHELPPGHVMTWDAHGERTWAWWRPGFERRAGPEPTVAEAAHAVRDALVDAVPRHLVTDREVGLFLSSGVDSGGLARVAAQAQGELRSLTVSFPDDVRDEGREAAALASTLGLQHQEVEVRGEEAAGALSEIVQAMDQPTADGVNTWFVSRAAHQAGLVVALSGVGGDELFGGYPTFTQVPRAASVAAGLHALPAAARHAAAGLAARREPGGRVTRLLSASRGMGGAYRAVRGLFGMHDLERFGVVDWIGEAEATRMFTPMDPCLGSPGDDVVALELSGYLRNQLLRDTDQMAMAHSLEVRVPLLDDRVVAAALAIPPSVRNLPGKEVLRRATGVPDGGVKRGFTLPIDVWMRGPLREPIRAAVCSDDLPFSWLLDGAHRRRLWTAFEEGRTHWSRPWAIGALRLWADGRGLRW